LLENHLLVALLCTIKMSTSAMCTEKQICNMILKSRFGCTLVSWNIQSCQAACGDEL